MTEDQKTKCHAAIHAAAAAAAAVGAGLAQIPLADSAVILPIQVAMIVALGKTFGKDITDSTAKAAALSVVGGYFGRAVSQVLVGWIPGVGNAINATTAAGITEAMGWAVAKKFDKDEM